MLVTKYVSINLQKDKQNMCIRNKSRNYKTIYHSSISHIPLYLLFDSNILQCCAYDSSNSFSHLNDQSPSSYTLELGYPLDLSTQIEICFLAKVKETLMFSIPSL